MRVVESGRLAGGRILRYLRRARTVLQAALTVLRFRVAVVLAVSVISICARGGALCALMLFVRQVVNESAATPTWLGLLAFGVDTPVWSAIVCLSLFLVAASTSFACERLSARYAMECAEKLIPSRFGPALCGMEKIDPVVVSRVLGAGAFRFARVVRVFLGFPLAALTFLLGLGMLLLISVPLTLGLLVLFPIILLPLYFLNRNVVYENREMPHLAEGQRQAAKRTVEALQKDSSSEAVEAALRDFTRDAAVHRRNRIVVQNWTLGVRVGLASEIFGSGLLVAMAFSLPFLLGVVKELAAEMLGYIVAMRYALNAMKDMAQRMTTVSRFLDVAECLLNPSLVALRFPGTGADGSDDDALDDV